MYERVYPHRHDTLHSNLIRNAVVKIRDGGTNIYSCYGVPTWVEAIAWRQY